MNPWGLLVIGIGVVLIIIGVKGSQHNIAGAIVNKQTGNKSQNNSSSGGTTTTSTLV